MLQHQVLEHSVEQLKILQVASLMTSMAQPW